jgi:hypothetical protein
MKITEVTSKTPTPDQARIRALQAQAKRAREAVKAERARQQITKAQNQMIELR